MRGLPFFKPKKGAQFAGLGFSDGGGGGGSYVLPTATSDTLGGVKVGSNISIDAGGAISVPDSLEEKATFPTASADELGNRYIYTGETGGDLTKGYVYECVSDGGDPATYSWVASNVQAPYTLPTASASTLGGVKVGDGLGISNGAIFSLIPFVDILIADEGLNNATSLEAIINVIFNHPDRKLYTNIGTHDMLAIRSTLNFTQNITYVSCIFNPISSRFNSVLDIIIDVYAFDDIGKHAYTKKIFKYDNIVYQTKWVELECD